MKNYFHLLIIKLCNKEKFCEDKYAPEKIINLL